jgi:hypothetical protein
VRWLTRRRAPKPAQPITVLVVHLLDGSTREYSTTQWYCEYEAHVRADGSLEVQHLRWPREPGNPWRSVEAIFSPGIWGGTERLKITLDGVTKKDRPAESPEAWRQACYDAETDLSYTEWAAERARQRRSVDGD